MSESNFETEAYGPDGMEERDLCLAVGEDLTKHYPDHKWMVGYIKQSGMVDIRLLYSEESHLVNFGFKLARATLTHQKVMHAGGELLERYGLPRGPANDESALRARQNGLDITGAVMKSKC